MSVRWPDLELLRHGRDGLLALSPLSQATARQAMAEALRRIKPELGRLGDHRPDTAIVDALAACVQVMGFYHDRFLTESKLGSAQLLDNLAKIVALVGYRPLPSVAATAYQFFEAIAAGPVGARTRVAGKILVPPSTVTFETEAGIEVSPDHNRMALSPLITRSAGARRAIVTPPIADPAAPAIAAIATVQQARGPALPTDDFRPRTLAMIADAHGVELAQVSSSRSRGVAFGRALSRSFDLSSALISRTTVFRHLRGPRTLADDLVAFEVSEAPILHLPSVAAPELLTSTLEIFVLRPGDDSRDPSEWDPALRHVEVFDFSGSDVSDLHYRTFVDDALHTWIILRKRLGAQLLLDDAALRRVYARFVPAVGSVPGSVPDEPPDAASSEQPSLAPDLTGATFGLDPSYFATSLVLPPIANTRLTASATWAMVDRDLGLSAGDSIVIQDAGRRWVRTLLDSTPGTSARLLRWAVDPPGFTARRGLPEAHDPIDGPLDPASAKIGSLDDAANGDEFPTWSELYAQLKPPGSAEPATDLPIVLSSSGGVIERRRVVAAGTTYVVLRDTSHISAGDYLLLGQRLTKQFRSPQPSGSWRWKRGEPAFDPRTPWLDAEVVQALEVRGNVVRLATPVSQHYFVHHGRRDAAAEPELMSEVVALPGVVSVASGDQLRQTLSLSTQPTFSGNDPERYEASYVVAALDHAYPADALRRPLLPAGGRLPRVLGRAVAPPPTPRQLWDTLFMAVAGATEAQTTAVWDLGVIVRCRSLRAPADKIVRLEDATGARLTADDIAGGLGTESTLPLISAAAAARIAGASDGSVVAVLDAPPVWHVTDEAPGANEARVDAAASFALVPEPAELGRAYLLDEHGAVVIIADPRPGEPRGEHRFRFTWDADAGAPRVEAPTSAVRAPFEAVFVSTTQGVDLRSPAAAATSAGWQIPGPAFAPPAFGQLAAGVLVAATDAGEIAFECDFTRSAGGLELHGVPITSIADPLRGVATAWAVLPGDATIVPAAVQARWSHELLADEPAVLPRSATVRLALIGARREIVDAHTSADGRSATVDPGTGAPAGDLGFALDALCALQGEPVAGDQIAESAIWIWRGIDPALADLPEPSDSRFIAVLASPDGHGVTTMAWRRDQVWWVPERRTLLLPIAPLGTSPGVRPSDVVRLVQVLAPAIDSHRVDIRYDRTTDRSIATIAMAPGWPGVERIPAPVVIATTVDGAIDVRDTVAPVDVLTDADGRVRWSMHFAGDMRRRWRSLSIALRDWPAPAEHGLAAAPRWRVPASEQWRTRAASGSVMLIAALRDQADFVALAAIARVSGDAIELAPLDREDAFPAAAAVAQLDAAVYTARAIARPALRLRGTTVLELDATAGQLPPVIAVVFEDGTRWRPIDVSGTTRLPDGRVHYELGLAYLSVFPHGIANQQRVRLCHGKRELTGAIPATATTLRLALSGAGRSWARGLGANAAVFHDGADSADIADRAVLDTASAPRMDGDALIVELALHDRGLGEIVDDGGELRWSRLELAQHWRDLGPSSMIAQPLRVTLGSPAPYPIGPGDAVMLGFAEGAPATAEIVAYRSDGALVLSTAAERVPSTITLYGLRTPIAPADYSATLDLAPSSQQPPWLMSFANAPSPDSLLATLLPYAATAATSDGTGRQRFQFAGDETLVEIFSHARDTLYLFTNERDELRGDFYTGSDDHVAEDLDGAPALNFLDAVLAPGATIGQLLLTSSAWAGKATDPHPVILCSTAWAGPRLPPAQFPELKIVKAEHRRVPTGIVLQSIRFNSGNFIPAAGATPATATAVIASALRVSALAVGLDGSPVDGARWKPVSFVPLDQLSKLDPASTAQEPPGGLAALAGMTYREAVDTGRTNLDENYAFSASFSAAGACSLHFLFVDGALIETVRVRIETQYEVEPGRTGDGLADPIYPLETAIAPLDPATHLALLAPGPLKPGALVFVRMPGDGVPALQWTRVTGVTGSIVDVDPPIAYAQTGLEPIQVTALGKLERAARLDADYYAAVANAKLAPGPQQVPPLRDLVQPLRDRLPLDVTRGPGAPVIAALIPGDLVLVFDERKRQAWAARRRGGSAGPASEHDWQHWPDFQHQAVVKRVDADTGLVVLAAPLPDRFQIHWTLNPETGRLSAPDDDVAALRVLPHYRAPVQGQRTLAGLGSGDSTRRFARFVGTLDAGIGSAVIPLDRDGVTTGNLEVLSFDPEKATWTRWLRHDALARAGKKDPAFQLGFRPADATGQVPVSVAFGDGLTGQLLPTGSDNVYLRATRIGAAASWLVQRRPLRIARRTATPASLQIARGIAPANSLTLRIEHSAPAELSGGADLASAQWRPVLEVTVTTGGATRDFREISEDDVAHGAHGFVLVSQPDMPPGVVDVQLYAPTPLVDAAVAAWQIPGSRQWALDARFYQTLSRPDLTAAPGAKALQLLSTAGLRAGSLLAVFPDPDSPPDIVRLASVDPPTWSAVVHEPLSRAYDLERSFIRGNVATIVQGAVDRITIGSSDGVTAFLRLPLQNTAPLLYLVAPGSEPAPDVTVVVADQVWTRVVDFTTETPVKRVWRLDVDPDGRAFVQFGDGKRGAIPPAGRDHITATVRVGSGAAGNLATGAINKLVTDNLAVRATTNLTPAAGGSAGDSAAEAREKAFAHRLPSDRVVSAVDCVGIAIGESGVIAAALDPTAPAGAIQLIVAMEDRRAPTAADRAAVRARVTGAMPMTASAAVEVVAAEQRAVHIVVELGVLAGREPATVLAAVQRAFSAGPGGFFAADHWDIGEPLGVGAIYDAMFRVDGVAHARVLWMAAAPLLEGEAAPGPAPDVFDPGATGVVRCDNDPVADPFGRLGTFRLQPQEAIA